MKYLKVFESFESLYNRISEEEFTSISNRSDINFEQKYIEQVELILNPEYRINIRNLKTSAPTHLDITHFDMDSNWEIWQTTDEWFMIHLTRMDEKNHTEPGTEFFECDTIDGLIELLRDYDVVS